MAKTISASERINEEKMVANIRRSWSMFHREGTVSEVRLFLRVAASSSLWGGGYGTIISGYFDSVDALIPLVTAIEKQFSPDASYITVNPIDPILKARSYNKFRAAKRGESTPDKHAVRRSWLMIDFDPIRPRGITATDEEVAATFDRCMEVVEALRKQGWPDPIIVFSGNGYHLYYLIIVGNTAPIAELLSDILNSIQLQFGDKEADAPKDALGSTVKDGEIGIAIDPSVFSAAQLTKLAGTWARKGDDLPDRPHRQSYVLSVPDNQQAVTVRQLDRLADIYRQYKKELDQIRLKGKASSGRETIIGRFKREHPVQEYMLEFGYTLAHGDRYNHPEGDGKSVLLNKDDGRTKHFSKNDPLYGLPKDSFDYEVILRFGGDEQAAIEYWSGQYRMPLRSKNYKNGSTPHPPSDVQHLENLPSDAEPEQPPIAVEYEVVRTATEQATEIVGVREIKKILFETFVENMRRRAATIYNRETIISCMFDEENGNARLLNAVLGSAVVFDHIEASWYWFNHLYWQQDDKSDIFYLASEILRYCYDLLYTDLLKDVSEMEAAAQEGDGYDEAQAERLRTLNGQKKMAYSRSKEVCNITKIRNTLAFAVAGERMGISGDEWDNNTDR